MPLPPSTPSRVLSVAALAMLVIAGALLVIAKASLPTLGPAGPATALAPTRSRGTPRATSSLTATGRTTGTHATSVTLTVADSLTKTNPARPITDTSITAQLTTTAGTPMGAAIGSPVEPVSGTEGEGDAVSGTIEAAPLPTGVTAGTGTVMTLVPPPPLFSFARPFDGRHDNRPSRYYPYGTNANGSLLLHHGVDIGNPMGAEVLAIGDGQVVYAGSDRQQAYGPMTNFYGNVIVIQHPEQLDGRPLYSLYGHLSRIDVQNGQSVGRGQQIGLVGSAGIALGPHLHLEIRLAPQDYEATLNSELFIQPVKGTGAIVGRVKDAQDKPLPSRPISLFRAGPKRTETWVADTKSYPANHVNSVPALGENFLFADTPAGDYVIHADLGRRGPSKARVHVGEGELVFVTLAP